MSTAVEDIIKKVNLLNLTEQLELIAYLAQRSRELAEAREVRHTWSELSGIVGYSLLGEDAQTYITRTREESDKAREEGSTGA